MRPAMRPWVVPALLALLLLPGAAAQDGDGDDVHVSAGEYHALGLLGERGTRYNVTFASDVAVDVFLLRGDIAAFYANGTGQAIALGLNATAGTRFGILEQDGPWFLVVDNTARQLAQGGNGTGNATVRLQVSLAAREPVVVLDPGHGGSRNPWPVLMLTTPHWDLGLLGLGGAALWMLLFAVAAAVGYRAGWDKVAVLAAGVAVLVAGWSLLPHPGPVSQIGFPVLLGMAVAWLATRGTDDGRQAARMALVAAVLGAIAGVTLGYLLSLLWSEPGFFVLGGERFDDPIFTVGATAFAGALLLVLIKAFVEAFDEEETPAAPTPAGLGATFTVTCLRCHTPIKVDRSMRRYRVATDRFEFACPNCHAWMEWAEPKPEGAAAA